MPVKTIPSLPKLLHAFFHEWLARQRNPSHQTVLAYRDTWRLFLCFVAAPEVKVALLSLNDLNPPPRYGLPSPHREDAPDVHRNAELPAGRAPQLLSLCRRTGAAGGAECAEVLQIPTKKAPNRDRYLESAEVAAILGQPNRASAEGQRDHALLSLLYNTGARIQEALDLRPEDLHLKSPAHVRLMGKGQK